MVIINSGLIHQRGSAQGSLIWIVVILLVGMIVKSEFFPSIEGSSTDQLISRFGQPISKNAMPRPR